MKMLCDVLMMKMLDPEMMVIVPRIKMRSALLDDDVDTGAGGDGSLHFYLPLPSITFTTQPPRNLCPL